MCSVTPGDFWEGPGRLSLCFLLLYKVPDKSSLIIGGVIEVGRTGREGGLVEVVGRTW